MATAAKNKIVRAYTAKDIESDNLVEIQAQLILFSDIQTIYAAIDKLRRWKGR